MKTIRVSEATNTQLDWLVAKCWYTDRRTELGVLGHAAFAVERAPGSGDHCTGWMLFTPTTDPAQMWPIIDREGIGVKRIRPVEHYGRIYTHAVWEAETRRRNGIREQYQLGPTSLIAAARCYVASKLGGTVEVPEELT